MMNPYTKPGKRAVVACFTCATLAACGGSGGGGGGGGEPIPVSDDYIRLENTVAVGETPLAYVALDVSNRTSSGFAGTLDHDGGIIESGLLSGAINDGRTRVTKSGGVTVTLENPPSAGTDHARIFSTSGLSTDRFGVVGQLTNAADIPDMGGSTYNGYVELQADNGNDTFALTGDARITVGWAATNDVNSVFDELDGRRNDIENVQNVGSISITGARLTSNGFSGGTITTSGDDLAYSGGGTERNEGRFFGPAATEVGGVFGVTDPDEIEISGVFVASGGLD